MAEETAETSPEQNSELSGPGGENIGQFPSSLSASTSTNMEVHHHPKVEKKGFREYFLEFIMIFLAVTLGFIAENIRENISENSKARELAESLYEEVYADSVNMHNKIALRLQKEEQMEYFRKYILDSNLNSVSEKFYPSFAWTFVLTTSIIFEPDNAVLNQLINSGALRYFKNVKLQKDIGRLNVAISNIKTRNGQEFSFVDQYTRPFMLRHFDFKWQDEYTQNGRLSILEALMQKDFHSKQMPALKNIADIKRSDAEGLTAYYMLILRGTRQIHYKNFLENSHELLETLRDEYGFR